MAKKKTVKTKKKVAVEHVPVEDAMIIFQVQVAERLSEIETRIDRIVEAIDKSKSVRGL